jgi:hypothetical protein
MCYGAGFCTMHTSLYADTVAAHQKPVFARHFFSMQAGTQGLAITCAHAIGAHRTEFAR